jgi:hypothetical protein
VRYTGKRRASLRLRSFAYGNQKLQQGKYAVSRSKYAASKTSCDKAAELFSSIDCSDPLDLMRINANRS